MYNVNREKQSFITYGLEKVVGELRFPVIELEEEIPYVQADVLSLTEDYLKTVLSIYHDLEVKYVNESLDGTCLTLLYEITMNHAGSYAPTRIWFATIHEIGNSGEMCGVPIAKEVAAELRGNYMDELWEVVPSIYYHGGELKRMKFESLFGKSRRDEGDGKGNVYRFYEYDEAVASASSAAVPAVVRYAIFVDGDTVDSYHDFLPLTLHSCLSQSF